MISRRQIIQVSQEVKPGAASESGREMAMPPPPPSDRFKHNRRLAALAAGSGKQAGARAKRGERQEFCATGGAPRQVARQFERDDNFKYFKSCDLNRGEEQDHEDEDDGQAETMLLDEPGARASRRGKSSQRARAGEGAPASGGTKLASNKTPPARIEANAGPHEPAEGRHFDPYSVYGEEDEEEDVWYSEERLFEDHIQEIVDKWRSIDDEIWAKIICMERNRRVAKAYARKHTILVDGSRDDYLDGTTLGLNSFDNPDRDSKTSYMKQHIGEGVKLKIQHNGDILVKRLSKANVFVHHFKVPAGGRAASGLVPGRLKAAQSSSDVYALNSESAGEFYGVVGPRRCAQAPLKLAGRFLKQPADQSKSSSGASSRSPTSSSASSSATSTASSTSSNGATGQNPAAAATKTCAANANNNNNGNSSHHLNNKPNALQANRVVRIFNMDKFKEALEFEARQPAPNRARLQSMCLSILSFVDDDQKMLNLPAWIMIINIVAMDLLASEIGLVGPYDMTCGGPEALMSAYRFHAVRPGGMGARNQLLASFEPHFQPGAGATTDGYDQCDFDDDDDAPDENERYRKFNGLSSRLNGRLESATGNKLAGGGGEAASSSSGFNSNYSMQNGGSTTSSSSIDLVAPALGGAQAAEESSPVVKKKTSKFRRLFRGAGTASSGEKEAEGEAPRQLLGAGGKRPPKPAAHEQGGAVMSKPIPIPAPPTSAGGPSGKANLILVSPTGLSPPLAKRSTTSSFVGQQKLQIGAGGLLESQEFDTIKHIDEEGRCNVLLDQRQAPKLPTGIPAHAQLAPPATQRHILRYLMSTAKNLGGANYPTAAQAHQAQQSDYSVGKPFGALPPVPPGRRLQRPLPVLPPGHQKPPLNRLMPNTAGAAAASDESLYYSGLQARVPNHHAHRQALPMQPIITKGAIDAILTDFKQSAHFRQQQQQLNQLRHQQLLLAKMRSNSASQLVPSASDFVNKNPAYAVGQRSATNASGTAKTAWEQSLRRDLGGQNYMRSLDSLNRQFGDGAASTNGGSSKPLSSLFTHVGGFLKRSKQSMKRAGDGVEAK